MRFRTSLIAGMISECLSAFSSLNSYRSMPCFWPRVCNSVGKASCEGPPQSDTSGGGTVHVVNLERRRPKEFSRIPRVLDAMAAMAMVGCNQPLAAMGMPTALKQKAQSRFWQSRRSVR